MPHDANGQELKVGDEVFVLATVKEVHPTEDYYNVTLTTVHPRKPDGQHETLTLNAATVHRAPVGSEVVTAGGVMIQGE